MTKRVIWGAAAFNSIVALIWWTAWMLKVTSHSDWWAFPTYMTGSFVLACVISTGIIKASE